MYNVGDIIVYGEHGICRVAAVGPLDLGGPGGRLYYTLHPYYQPELVIYAPIDNERVVIRPPITREQAEQIVSELSSEQICDTSQLGIYGYSLGGMTAFYTAAFGNVSPEVIMTVAAVPDFQYVIENSSDKMAAKYSVEKRRLVKTTESDNQRLLAWAQSHNPADQIEKLSEIPIIMVNGTDDPYMSIDKVREFQKEIEENGGSVRVFENQGGTHTDPGDYHAESILEILSDIFTAEK